MALEALFRRYDQYVCAIALRIAGLNDDLDHVFLSAMRALGTFHNSPLALLRAVKQALLPELAHSGRPSSRYHAALALLAAARALDPTDLGAVRVACEAIKLASPGRPDSDTAR